MSASRSLSDALATSIAIVTSLAMLVAATSIGLSMAAPTASAQIDDEDFVQRDQWQQEYRSLLRDRARLIDNIAISKKNYAQAQRRNYPRGGARQKFLIDADDATKDLAATDEAIREIFAAARRKGIPPGWLFEVEDEPITMTQAAAPIFDDEEDRDGRNPLYFENDDDF